MFYWEKESDELDYCTLSMSFGIISFLEALATVTVILSKENDTHKGKTYNNYILHVNLKINILVNTIFYCKYFYF